MRNNVRLLQLMAMLFCILVVVSATSVQSLFKTNAQNTQISPQYGCLGPCTSGTPSVTPTNNGTGATISVSVQPASPSSAVISIAPSTQPCTTTALSSLSTASQSADQVRPNQAKNSHGKGGHHHNGGFLKDILQLFLLLIDMFLKLVGAGGNVTPCPPTISPTLSPAPSLPVASASPVISTIPASSAATTGTNASTNPSTINANSGIFSGGPFGNSCKPGQLYCNGHVVTGGKNNTLYTCEPYNAPSVKQTCSGACKVNASGNDSC